MDITAGGYFLGLCDQKIHINMCPILDGYSRTHPCVNRVLRNRLAGDVLNLVAYRLPKLQRATRAVHNRAAARVAAGCGILENQL